VSSKPGALQAALSIALSLIVQCTSAFAGTVLLLSALVS
jgi:hypothetical protein